MKLTFFINSFFESLIKSQFEANCKLDNLYQVFVNVTFYPETGVVDAAGHCAFNGTQLILAVAGMSSWIETGHKPTTGFFEVDQGFDPSFVPANWETYFYVP